MAVNARTPGARHAYYLGLKAQGYYKTACPKCRRPKSLRSKYCSICAGNHARPTLCLCGKRMHRQAKRCQDCWDALRVQIPRMDDPANSFCPNGDFGSSQCATREPHAHCVECSEPILDPTRTLCDQCKKDAARIAAKILARQAA